MKAAPHTVIYTHGAGRLGNQVIRFAHWMAWVRAHPGQVEVCNFSFWPFADYFVTWREHPGCVFPLRKSRADRLARWRAALPGWMRSAVEARSRLQRCVQAAGRWWPGAQAIELNIRKHEGIDLDDPGFFARIAQRRVTTCCGWQIASWPLLAQQQEGLRGYFQPVPEFEQPAKTFIGGLRERHDLVIGVLIRQSDYASWDAGRFFFSTAQYAEWIRQVVELHPGQRVAVVVASEEWQDPQLFAGLPVFLATGNPRAGGHWFENWVELSLCDFIVSAPSTFSATAAFRGNVPLWPVVAAGQVMAPDQLIRDGMVGAARHLVFSRSVK
jgi:hypothetical protein